MSKVVELSDESFRDLQEQASASGTTPAEWVAARIPGRISPPSAAEDGTPRSLADEFAGRLGRLSSGRSDLSERVGELFSDAMVEKRRAGRL